MNHTREALGTARARAARPDREGGFILIESIIAIGVVAIVMTGLAMFFVNAVHSSGQIRASQTASVVADNTIDQIRAFPKPSNLYAGRTSTAVANQFSTAPAKVTPWLSQMYPVYSDTAVSSVPLPATMPTTTVNSVVYTPTNYLGQCAIPIDAANGTACKTSCPSTTPSVLGTCTPGYANTVDTAPYLRVVVAVTWANSTCPSSKCVYVTSTLLSANPSDPDFLLQTTPPNAPVVSNPGTQNSAVNDAVSLQLATTSNKVVNPVQWTVSGLPSGLQMANAFSGLITGTPTTTNGVGQLVSVSATDAFGRQSPTITFTWKVLPDITTTAPATVTAAQYNALSPSVSVVAAGGSGSPYTFTVPSSGSTALPPGLTYTTNSTTLTISGTPTTAGTFSSVVTVADSSGRTRTFTTVWTVVPRPAVNNLPATLTVLAGWTAVSPMTYSCPFTSCTFTVSGAPSGAYLATTATATTGTASVAVTAASGNLYLISPTITGAGPWNITVTGAQTGYPTNTGLPDTAVWTKASGTNVLNNASATPLSNPSGAVNQQISSACTSGTCTVSFTGVAGNWLSLASSGTPVSSVSVSSTTTSFWVRGTIPSGVAAAYPVSVTITDANGDTLTETATFTRLLS